MDRFDVIVVGARCAGSPLATLLARRGLRVCVLDRAHFPSDTPSTHVIQPNGVDALDRLGVLAPLSAAGAVPLDQFTLVYEGARITAGVAGGATGTPGLCVRRLTLDSLLVDAAASAGADVRTGTRVTGLLEDDNGRVNGVETAQGPVHAALVVGADGRHSTVADLVGAAEYHVAPPGRLFAWSYFEGVADTEGRLRIGRLADLVFAAAPVDSGLYLAAVGPSLDAKADFLADRERGYVDGIAGWPELADLVAGATRVGPVRVVHDWHGFFRESAGPGWVLVGDAGNFKDPTPAQGISDALRQAEHLADAVESGLGGPVGIDDTLASWWRWRDEDAYDMHWFAADMGASGPATPLITRIMHDIAGDEVASATLLSVLDHKIRPAGLLTARRLGKAAAGVIRERPGQLPALIKEVASEGRNEVRRFRTRGTHLPPPSPQSCRTLRSLVPSGPKPEQAQPFSPRA